MRIWTMAAVAAAGAFALAGCAPKTAAPAAGDAANDEAAIKAWVDGFNAAYKAHDAEKMAASDDPSVEGYVPFGKVQKGPETVDQIKADFAADPALIVQLAVDRVEVSKGGDLGYAIGDFQRTATDPKTKAAATSSGGYVLVVKKGADGAWKLVAYSATPGPAAAPPAAAPAKN